MNKPITRKVLLLCFLAVLLVKTAEVELLTALEYRQHPEAAGGHWASINGDSFSYIGAMENYLTSGTYFFVNEKGEVTKAGRLPHYAIPYFLFRQLFSPSRSLDLLVLLQIAAEAAASVALALFAFYITGKRWCYYTSLVLSAVSLYVTSWAYSTYTDSLSTHLLFLAAFFYYRYLHSFRSRNFLWCSLLLAAATCLRPYLVLLYAVAGSVELFREGFLVRNTVRKLALLALPLLLLLAPWMVRNFLVLDRLVVFQQDMYAGYGIGAGDVAIRRVLASMGEVGGMWWDRKSAASYFNKKSVASSSYAYPAYIRRDSAAFNRLEALRSLSLHEGTNIEEVQERAEDFLIFYKTHYPLRFYVGNRLLLVSRFLLHNGSYRLPLDTANPLHLFLKIIQSFLYYCYLGVGTIGLLKLARTNPKHYLFLVPAIYLILLFPLFFRLTEWKYFLPFYHFHQIGLLFLLYWYTERKAMGKSLEPMPVREAF